MSARGIVRRASSEAGTTIVELLIASLVGLGVVAAAVQLLRTHADVALRTQAALGASSGAAWALRVALEDVKRAGADPAGRDLEAVAAAGSTWIATLRDLDGDGRIDDRSAESVGVAWSERGTGSVARRVGAQSMAIVSRVPRGGLRLRYYDADGRELAIGGGLDRVARRRIRRVEMEVDVRQTVGTIEGRASYAGGASVRVREGRP